MSFYQINSNDLRNKEGDLEMLLQKFRSEKENLISNESALSTMWEGEANNSFHQMFIRNIGQMEAFIALIDNYARVMGSIADRYDSAEARNTNLASKRSY